MSINPIYVTKPFLPPLEEFIKSLEKIWKTSILTNMGPFHQELEKKLCEYLDVPYISLFANATLALYTSLKVLDLENCDIITTPFTFPATVHVIKLVNSTPIFVDIDKNTGCLDAFLIKNAITLKTKAIMPVHVYGNPCDVFLINKIAKKNNLKVIYDAAHCFGFDEVLKFGDLSVLSFHATKIFNTIEGGAIISYSEDMKNKIDRFKNFGIKYEDLIPDIGFNAKMNELQAAFGLLSLNYIEQIFDRRIEIADYYDKCLRGHVNIFGSYNNSYYPIIVENRELIFNYLKGKDIYVRKYFYPLISNLEKYRDISSASPLNLPCANSIAEKILCLPIYPELDKEDQKIVIKNLLDIVHSGGN
jgi:dTDP-4-amino-4,6-dideoxygalactose transaminase